MNLVLIVGPTGVGKTDRAVERARSLDAPIVVLDRVQCHPELAVGSGRHVPDRTAERIFLDERRVVDGIIPAPAAYRRLCQVLEAQRIAGRRAVVLEGGSISLLTAMTADRRWRQESDVTVEVLAPAAGTHRARVSRRVRAMLLGERSMLDEVRALLPDLRTHRVLDGIVGYREIVATMRAAGTPHPDGALVEWLIEAVTAAHVAYAREQCDRFGGALALR
jgi:adenylate dimethylallyltransferase